MHGKKERQVNDYELKNVYIILEFSGNNKPVLIVPYLEYAVALSIY